MSENCNSNKIYFGKCNQNIPMCSFSVGQGFFFAKNLKILIKVRQSKRKNFTRSVQISIESGTNTLAYGLRANIVRPRAKRANMRANKKPWKNKSCENRAWKKRVVRTSCERCEHFIQIPLLAKISPKKITNFAQKSAYSNFWPEIAWVCSKNLNILFSDGKPPEFALKSAYWIFWPILARFFQKPAHFKFLTEISLEFSQKAALFWLWQKLAWLYPATCAS